MAEVQPLMENTSGLRNTTAQFLRSFSVLSDDSDFDELDEPDTADFLDGPSCAGTQTSGGAQDVDLSVNHTVSGGVNLETSRRSDMSESKIIPFVTIHKEKKKFEHIRPDCWLKAPITVQIVDVQRKEHPHMTRKAFNPNLYVIKVTHGPHTWKVNRRYKHFDSLHKALRLFRARYSFPMPSKQHRERRQSMRDERKERKKNKQTKKISRFPKKPEILVGGEKDALEKRRMHLEQYLQSILQSKWFRNHSEVLKFLEVSELSFVNQLGTKWKEGDINKCSGGRRISIGCCGCLKKFHLFGRWSDRWLIVKDTFIAYIRPSDGCVCDVMLMDSDFRVESGMSATGAHHGLLVTNLTRCLLAKCWTNRKAEEWVTSMQEAADTTGSDFTKVNRFRSFAPVRDNSYARWFVDGSSYFEAVADAIEKAKEEIFITDWWLSPEIYLKRMVTDREKWRLDEILGRKARAGVKVFVLLYKELEIALTIDSRYSKDRLISKCPENIKVIRHPDHVAGGNRVLLWGHHEKLVVIDQKTAFVGGIDLCYGRWDDEKHRMTDLGSVTYNSLPNSIDLIPTNQNGDTPVTNTGNGSIQKRTKKLNISHRLPSMIKEDSETSLNEIGITVDETGDNANQSRTSTKRKSASDLPSDNYRSCDDENYRHSLCSEQDFGSSDILTENDSLENVEKASYTNVVADVMVHSSVVDDSIAVTGTSIEDVTLTETDETDHQGSGDNISPKCNIKENGAARKTSVGESNDTKSSSTKNSSNANDSTNSETVDKSEDDQLEQTSKHIPKEGDTNNGEIINKDLDEVDSGKDQTTGVQITDLNENRTHKGSVRFREEDSVIEDEISAEKAAPLESIFSKKDAAHKRETWASRKLKKTFGLKKEEDDVVDGKDSDDEETPKTRNKWRMVLNIKKLEHAGKKAEDEEKLRPESPYAKDHHLKSPSASLTSRIRQSMPFRTQRKDSDEDMYFSLYPWKRRYHRRDDGRPVTITSVMKLQDQESESDLEGLKGQSKLWIGKDYVNFIHKDPVDVRNPFEDFIKRDETPRMPWHDIASVVYGKAARDVARHFIRRWNFCKTEKFKKNKKYPLLMPKAYTKCDVAPAIKDITYQVKSQVLRSVCGWSAGVQETEKSIHEAIIHKIETAKHYIYLENQFFITQIADHSLVKNDVGEALLKRIEKAYRENETFRVFVVLPLLPAFEGEIGENGGYAIQAVLHWNYKSISKGPHSLWHHLKKRVDDPKKYVVFCGLRTHAELRGRLVTELVYVHSKLMIVDDDTVIVGSANINDRSLLGTRDSEVCMMYEDIHKFPVKMDGKEHMAGNFAASIRRTLFREHLGIEEYDETVDLSDPIGDAFWKNVWFRQATVNTSVYFKVFNCIPDDHIKSFAQLKVIADQRPLAETDPETARAELTKVKGRLVFLPLYFLEEQESIIPPGTTKESVMPVKLWT